MPFFYLFLILAQLVKIVQCIPENSPKAVSNGGDIIVSHESYRVEDYWNNTLSGKVWYSSRPNDLTSWIRIGEYAP